MKRTASAWVIVSLARPPLEAPEREWADLYKVSGLKITSRSNPSEDHSVAGVIAPPLSVYREKGHVRLDPRTYESKCRQCPWGVVMATEIIVDHWSPHNNTKWREETRCYGPSDCANYKAVKPRTIPGRKPGMIWIDDDVERGDRL